MTPEQFCYWLQGFAELSPKIAPNPTQWKQIQDHLNTVFKKVTPSYTELFKELKPDTYNPPPNWPRPEVICSVSNGASAGDSVYGVAGKGI